MTQVPPSPLMVCLRFNSAEFDAAVGDLSAALPDLRERSREAVERLIDLIEAGAELATFGLDGASAAGAGELVLVAQPSDGLQRLVTALRAGDFNLTVVEQAFGHGSHPSVGGCAIPTVTESSAAQKAAGDKVQSNDGDATS